MNKIFIKIIASFVRNIHRIPGSYFISLILQNIFNRTIQDSIQEYRFCNINFKVNIHEYMGQRLFWRGAQEWGPIYVLKKIIHPGMVALDVGANVGEYSLWLSKLVGRNGRVYAFEPTNKTYLDLMEHIKINMPDSSNIISYNIGLSDKDEILPVYIPKDNPDFGMASIYQHSNFSFLQNINLQNGSEFLASKEVVKIDFIKIDVEGAENKVIAGLIPIIEQHHPMLLIEINRLALKTSGTSSEELIEVINNLGYEIFIIGKRGKFRIINMNNIPDLCNVFAKKR